MPICSLKWVLFLLCVADAASPQGDLVKNWADKIGKELRDLGKIITKSDEIQSRYKISNAKIEKKEPEVLLSEIVKNIDRMMDRKMDAIWCIMSKAEEASENYTDPGLTEFSYYNSKYSKVDGKKKDNDTEKLIEKLVESGPRTFKDMYMNNDTHFYNLPINTSHSSVHVPTNIFDLHDEPRIAIQWSELLDEVFVQNYNSDPALSWQYFGSSTGIMRHYPALEWMTYEGGKGVDLFDCRIRTWFIEAATCTKDVVILLDNSGSMQGMGKHVASLAVTSILDTFSNNDFINIIVYNDTSKFLVPCFSDILVQATEENIQVFKEHVGTLKPDEKSNLVGALEAGFELLENVRERKKCTVDSADCNQAIMIVTDGVSDDPKPIIEKYNFLNNGSNIPVRIFTYLIGKEVINRDLVEIACNNRGYYSQIQALEQARQSVFQYIPVIARPLVLKGDHPISWTHAYTDITYDDSKDDQINEPYRLLTSVAIPAFDRKTNNNNQSRAANLLGVAATDVPIDDIAKLTLPYTIGVNAYAFIVSNNGYVLMHPDLRPVYKKVLKDNYNSVDLIDVEQIDDGFYPRNLNDTRRVIALRRALVNGDNGTMQNIQLKYHYDKMRRISKETYDYYFAPLTGTPFSIALAIPDKYGKYSLKIDDEIHTGRNLSNFFTGSNWKVHPKWVYCKYHYLEGHEYKNSEMELLHFLHKIDEGKIDFKWQGQYEYGDGDTEENLADKVCGERKNRLHEDDYYCDKQLMHRLIYDARNTKEAFKSAFVANDERDQKLFEKYNATLRFVATMSGLTRWEYISGIDEDNGLKEFGDFHPLAIDEVWYKSAVLQHERDPEAFVYSVPFDAENLEKVLVTGSYAIFPSDDEHEVAGSVVGFQFSHPHLQQSFQAIASKRTTECPNCSTCNDSSNFTCYIIDSSGYVVLSNNDSSNAYIGKFFGEIEEEVMESMVNKIKLFEKVTVYDLQAICPREIPKEAGKNHDKEKEIKWVPCEKEIDLFVLKREKFHENDVLNGPEDSYFVTKIPYSNLLLVTVSNPGRNILKISAEAICTTQPKDINNEKPFALQCKKKVLNQLERRRLVGCINEHELEHEIKECGRGSSSRANVLVILLTILVMKMC